MAILQISIVLLLLSLVAGIVGFSGLATDYAPAGQVLFAIFIGLFLLCAVAGAWRARQNAEQSHSNRRQGPFGGPGSQSKGVK